MTLYCDSSFLVQLYVPQESSEDITRYLAEEEREILFSPFHELELANAIQHQLFS